MSTPRKEQTQKRHRRLRRHLEGTPDRPRLAVYRSNEHIYAQVIDDAAQHTLAAASSLDKDLRTRHCIVDIGTIGACMNMKWHPDKKATDICEWQAWP